MKYNIDPVKFTSSFGKKNFQHCKGKIIKAFPFATDSHGLNESEKDFDSFNGVVGAFVRRAYNYGTFNSSIDKEDILEQIKNRKNFQGVDEVNILIDIIDKLLFDENNNIYKFDLKVLQFLQFSPNERNKAKLTDLADFICGLLFDDEVKEIIQKTDTPANENLLYRLVLDTLTQSHSDLKKEKSKELKGYYNGKLAQKVRSLFKKDIKTLSTDEDYFIENIDRLLKYYYLLYVSQLALQLNLFFKDGEKIPTLFFTLKWEKVSNTRLGIQNGWRLLEKNISDSFIHANCLEFLNCIEWNDNSLRLYSDIKTDILSLTEDEKSTLNASLQGLISQYKSEFIGDSHFKNGQTWDELTYKPTNDEAILNSIEELFQTIKFQFTHGRGKSAYEAYRSWFTRFCKVNFFKSRGPLGYSLSIDKELLLLMTDLAIGNTKEKILIKTLWDEFEQRGLNFDQQSKKEIISLYESINILEKKSDSGDAQFIQKLNK